MILPIISTDVAESLTRSRGLGTLAVEREGRRTPLPLRGVRVRAQVADRIAGVTVEQTFTNPHAEHLEAVYIFPLPGAAAVSGVELRVAGRTIHGVLKERAEARQDYQRAVEEGRRAALMEQERDDVFTVQLGNLPPGEEATVVIRYSETLSYLATGESELRLPTVVAPRYIAGEHLERDAVGDGTAEDTDRVPDASRITPPRLAPGFDPETDLTIEVELEAGAAGISGLRCAQHATRSDIAAGAVRVRLARTDERMDRDFILRWSLAGETPRPILRVQQSPSGAHYASLSVVPPALDETTTPTARDVVFVLDRSGSMDGQKMTWAARACARLLETLTPRDRYALLAFDTQFDWYEREGGRWHCADEGGVARGAQHLRSIDARGGTEIHGALRQALDLVDGERERQPVIVLITDGQVGDERSPLKEVKQRLGAARLFTVGVDTAVNEAFLRRLAKTGRGTATMVAPGEDIEEALRGVAREVGRPVITDLKIEDRGAGPQDITPAPIPDVFADRPATVWFRCARPGAVLVTGRLPDGTPWEERVEAREAELEALSHGWARARIAELEDRYRLAQASAERKRLKADIIALSTGHTVLSRFTAFVVVDQAEVVRGEHGALRQVVQPVETPAGWAAQQPPAMASGYMPGPSWVHNISNELAVGGFPSRAKKTAAFTHKTDAAPPPRAAGGLGGVAGSIARTLGGLARVFGRGGQGGAAPSDPELLFDGTDQEVVCEAEDFATEEVPAEEIGDGDDGLHEVVVRLIGALEGGDTLAQEQIEEVVASVGLHLEKLKQLGPDQREKAGLAERFGALTELLELLVREDVAQHPAALLVAAKRALAALDSREAPFWEATV
jgi:Ca-activated chloride channel family protein